METIRHWTRAVGDRITRKPSAMAPEDLEKLPESIRDHVKTMRTATRWKERVKAANQLHQSDSAAIPHLIDALDDPHPEVRVAAARALIWMEPENSRNATPRLIRMLKEEKNAQGRDIAATALGITGSTQAAPALIQALADRNAMVRHQVIEALSRLKYHDAAPAVHRLLTDKDDSVRKSAADFLGIARYGPAHDDLRQRLQTDSDHYVQRAAARALGHFQSENDVDLLMNVIGRKHVTDEAAKALGKIGEKILEKNPKPSLGHPLAFAIKHVDPAEHPQAFRIFHRDVQDPDYADLNTREWRLHAAQLKSDETALKAA